MMCNIFPVWIWCGTKFQVQRREGGGKGGQFHLEIVEKYDRGRENQHACIKKILQKHIHRFQSTIAEKIIPGKIIVLLLHTEISEQIQQGVFFNINCPWKIEFQNSCNTVSIWEEIQLSSVRCRAWNADCVLTSCSSCLSHPACSHLSRLLLSCLNWSPTRQKGKLSQQL